MANNKYNSYTNKLKQYFTNASSSGADIKLDPNEIQIFESSLKTLNAENEQLYSDVVSAANNIDAEVLNRYSISPLLINLQNNISKSIQAFDSNINGLSICNNGFNSADQTLANSMRGVQSLANMVMTPEGTFVPYNINGQIVMINIAQLNGLFGLNTSTNTQGTNLGFFDSIKNAFNKAKDTVAEVLDNKWVKVGLASASIISSVTLIAGSGILTVFSGGTATPGAVVVTTLGINNIISQASNIVSVIAENESISVNPLKDLGGKAIVETAGGVATALNKAGIVQEEYIDTVRDTARNGWNCAYDLLDVAVGNVEPVDDISKVFTLVSKLDDFVKPLNKINDILDWLERGDDAMQYIKSGIKLFNANMNIVQSEFLNLINSTKGAMK